MKAAKGGHLDVLEWAIKNGCPYEVNDQYTREDLKELGLARASQPLPSSRQGLILSSIRRSDGESDKSLGDQRAASFPRP